MPKTKSIHKSFRLTPGKSKLNLNFVVGLGIIIFLFIASIIYFSTSQQTPSINETTFAPYPIPVTRDCEIVYTFSLSGSCGGTKYQMTNFRCGKNGIIRKNENATRSCKDYTTLYKDAQSTCLSACPNQSQTPFPSSSPIVIYPSGSPTIIPGPSPTGFPPRSPLPYQTP
jgi:hypothetical protein